MSFHLVIHMHVIFVICISPIMIRQEQQFMLWKWMIEWTKYAKLCSIKSNNHNSIICGCYIRVGWYYGIIYHDTEVSWWSKLKRNFQYHIMVSSQYFYKYCDYRKIHCSEAFTLVEYFHVIFAVWVAVTVVLSKLTDKSTMNWLTYYIKFLYAVETLTRIKSNM